MRREMQSGRMPGDFDPGEFFRRPQVVLRLICILFAIVVFGCISSGAYDQNDNCLMNGDINACHYGVGIGVLAFLGCVLFLAIDSQFDSISNAQTKRYIVMGDLAFSLLWLFLWFVGFCYLSDAWRKTTEDLPTTNTNNIRASITFSFFSIISWIGLAMISFKKYRDGTFDFDFARADLPGETYSSPYASFPSPGSSDDPYQAQPFSSGPSSEHEYQPPAY